MTPAGDPDPDAATRRPRPWRALWDRLWLRVHRDTERGQVAILILGLTVITMVLITGGVAVTSVQLSRMRLLDAADAAALDAADSLDPDSYGGGFTGSVVLSDHTVRETAAAYLSSRERPHGLLSWRLAPGTGSPDGETAVVRMTGEANLPLVGELLSSLGGSVTITVEARARAHLDP